MAAEDNSYLEPSEKQQGDGQDGKPVQVVEREAGWGDYFR